MHGLGFDWKCCRSRQDGGLSLPDQMLFILRIYSKMMLIDLIGCRRFGNGYMRRRRCVSEKQVNQMMESPQARSFVFVCCRLYCRVVRCYGRWLDPGASAVFRNAECGITLFGTNKLASIWGIGAAAMNFAKRMRIEWNAALPASLAAFLFAFCGNDAVSHVPSDFVRKCLPLDLAAVAWYTYRFKHFGLLHAPVHRGTKERVFAVVAGGAIGFYDGFFGPGTGSFLIFYSYGVLALISLVRLPRQKWSMLPATSQPCYGLATAVM